MPLKLTYTKDGQTLERTPAALGSHSVVATRDNHRYKEEFSGTLILAGDDFDFVMQAGACTEIFVEFEWKRNWRGVFTHTDCQSINRSKKILEVQPRPDDEYSKIEPWMRLEMNIIPPLNGINSKVAVDTLNQYEIESKTIRITEPYAGPVQSGKVWTGYSVNDHVGGNNMLYQTFLGVENSLIWYLRQDIKPEWLGNFDTGVAYLASSVYQHQNHRVIPAAGSDYDFGSFDTIVCDQENTMLWLDYGGYERMIAKGGLAGYLSYFRVIGGLFTLTEVINYYDDQNKWEYCDLIYTREVFRGIAKPPSGNIANQYNLAKRIRGWAYLESEGIWVRRPLNAMANIFVNPATWPPQVFLQQLEYQSEISGNGTWFSTLIESRAEGRKIMKQVMYRNRLAENNYNDDWYRYLYGETTYSDHFHKTELLLKKFIHFVKSKGATTSLDPEDLHSEYLFSEINPYTGAKNLYNRMLVGQNSDIKRPFSSERATKEMISFADFLNTLCTFTNSAWAIINGKFIIEHISYFEKGLTYNPEPLPENIINPFSIQNTAKNKGFMNLTDIYNYDKVNMPKFEIYKTMGGSEPDNHNLTIEYEGACVSNLPESNIRETEIDTTTDYLYTRTDGRDEGITLILTRYSTGYEFYPSTDIFGRYVYNSDFTLQRVIRDFHSWGRNQVSALLNGAEWVNLTAFKNIIQNIAFPYQSDNNYSLVLTGLGHGVVLRSEFQSRKGWMEYELGFDKIEDLVADVSADWYVHEQKTSSAVWIVPHRMDTEFMMRPVVFGADNAQIEYNELIVLNSTTVRIGFSRAVAGTVHLISLSLPSNRVYTYAGQGSEWDIQHNLNKDISQLAISLITDRNNVEIRPQKISWIDGNRITVVFSSTVAGRVQVADITGYVSVLQADAVNTKSVSVSRGFDKVHGKPVVLQAGSEIFYYSDQLIGALRTIGFSEGVTANMIVVEKNK
jgi:hypothetical protein